MARGRTRVIWIRLEHTSRSMVGEHWFGIEGEYAIEQPTSVHDSYGQEPLADSIMISI